MDEQTKGFRSAVFGGFRREDVLRYIEETDAKYYEESERLRGSLDDAQTAMGELRGQNEKLTEKNAELLERLAACPAIRMHGFVTGKAYQAAFDGADAFVHVEAFDEENRDRVRYSVSTKIIESLASGRPLLAYGPEDVASMAYLRRNDCAALASSMQELPAVTKAVLTQEPYRWQLVERAAAVSRREADNSARLHALLERVAAGGAK